MGERRLDGTPAAPGVALGIAWRLREHHGEYAEAPTKEPAQELEAALGALAAAADQLSGLAAELPPEEAEIVETGALMGRDPALIDTIEHAIICDGLRAAEAILHATGAHAEAIAAIRDETLATRADDVRSLGRRAARLAGGRGDEQPPGRDVIVVATDLGPADVAELAPAVAGVALAGGGPTAHAAIVARSLGIPMVTGLGDEVRALADGDRLVLDGSSGAVAIEPAPERVRAAEYDMRARRLATARAYELRDQPAVTTDGKRIGVLANVVTPAELEVALHAGAEGIGLLRTELAFLNAPGWPTERDHAEALAPVLAGLGDRPAVVRVLDFGSDKSPPFLRGTPERGLPLLLAHPTALAAQLRAILGAAERCDVRILLPMVDTADQLLRVCELIGRLAPAPGPPLGAMIETPAAVANVAAIAEHADFLSIGTNDLTASVLGADRFEANAAQAHDPRVLRAIASSVAAAHAAGIRLEVCGEAASDPIMLPLLVGLGTDEVSVGAARVGQVRDWIGRIHAGQSAGIARAALAMESCAEVEAALGALVL
jgi:phosphoenolpyruvate-protein kinase (PTS system EI component)